MEYVGKARVWQRGQITLPARVRRKLNMDGDTILSVYEMGRGVLLVPGELTIDRLSREVQETMDREGVTLEDLLAALAEDRYGDAESPREAARRMIAADMDTGTGPRRTDDAE